MATARVTRPTMVKTLRETIASLEATLAIKERQIPDMKTHQTDLLRALGTALAVMRVCGRARVGG